MDMLFSLSIWFSFPFFHVFNELFNLGKHVVINPQTLLDMVYIFNYFLNLCGRQVVVKVVTVYQNIDLMVSDLSEGMKCLHGRAPSGFIHRDLKSLNILVRTLADAPELKYHEGYLNVKEADFGTATIKNLITRYSNRPVDIGTRLWMAPEMIGNEDDMDYESEHGSLRKFPFKVDVYSFAIV